mgnify:CR=1 FL=1
MATAATVITPRSAAGQHGTATPPPTLDIQLPPIGSPRGARGTAASPSTWLSSATQIYGSCCRAHDTTPRMGVLRLLLSATSKESSLRSERASGPAADSSPRNVKARLAATLQKAVRKNTEEAAGARQAAIFSRGGDAVLESPPPPPVGFEANSDRDKPRIARLSRAAVVLPPLIPSESIRSIDVSGGYVGNPHLLVVCTFACRLPKLQWLSMRDQRLFTQEALLDAAAAEESHRSSSPRQARQPTGLDVCRHLCDCLMEKAEAYRDPAIPLSIDLRGNELGETAAVAFLSAVRHAPYLVAVRLVDDGGPVAAGTVTDGGGGATQGPTSLTRLASSASWPTTAGGLLSEILSRLEAQCAKNAFRLSTFVAS